MDQDDDLAVTVRCGREMGTSVRMSGRYFPDDYGVGFSVGLRAPGLVAEIGPIEVWVWDEWLPEFLARLASDFSGWTDERVWRTERLEVRAVFHSGGHVALTWTVWPHLLRDTWRAGVVTWLEGGEEMRALAADMAEFLPVRTPGKS